MAGRVRDSSIRSQVATRAAQPAQGQVERWATGQAQRWATGQVRQQRLGARRVNLAVGEVAVSDHALIEAEEPRRRVAEDERGLPM